MIANIQINCTDNMNTPITLKTEEYTLFHTYNVCFGANRFRHKFLFSFVDLLVCRPYINLCINYSKLFFSS